MSDETRTEADGGAEILRLECARYEAALAEGTRGVAEERHRRACPDCARLTREMDQIGAWIADATGPAETPDEDFARGVLARADRMEGRFLGEEAKPRSAWASAQPWLAAAVAASVVLAFWMGTLSGEPRHAEPGGAEPVATTPAAPTDGTRSELDEDGEREPSTTREPVRLLPTSVPSEVTPEPPVVPAAQPVPEPSLDVPEALREAILRAVDRFEGCPDASAATVRATVTIQTDGSLTHRQVLSAGQASSAHRCVSRALDDVILPPLEEAMTVTLDLAW